jgi:hypothetical protein
MCLIYLKIILKSGRSLEPGSKCKVPHMILIVLSIYDMLECRKNDLGWVMGNQQLWSTWLQSCQSVYIQMPCLKLDNIETGLHGQNLEASGNIRFCSRERVALLHGCFVMGHSAFWILCTHPPMPSLSGTNGMSPGWTCTFRAHLDRAREALTLGGKFKE